MGVIKFSWMDIGITCMRPEVTSKRGNKSGAASREYERRGLPPGRAVNPWRDLPSLAFLHLC